MALKQRLRLIHLQADPIGRYWKPERSRFEACAYGSLLILAPWPDDLPSFASSYERSSIKRKRIKLLPENLEVSEKLLIFAAESPLVCKILGSVVKKQLRKLIPPCMINTWVKPPQGGFIFKVQADGQEESYSVR